MKARKEPEFVGAMATVTLKIYLPGVTVLKEAIQTIQRVLKVQMQKGDCLVMVDGADHRYSLITKARAKKLNLPERAA